MQTSINEHQNNFMVTESALQQRFSSTFYGNGGFRRHHGLKSEYSAEGNYRDTTKMAVPESLQIKVRAILKKNAPEEIVKKA